MLRKIIQIDEEKCNGCGACASACHEGAIGMVNGKAVVTPLTGSAKNHAMENAGKGGGGYVQNVNITSPKALSPYEVARQTRLQTRSMILAMQRG